MEYTKKGNKNRVDTCRWATYNGALSQTSTRSTRAARPLPEAPPQARGAGDLGPAKAESPARGRARLAGITAPRGVRERFSEFVTLSHAHRVWQAHHALTPCRSVKAGWRGTRREPRPCLSANPSTPCSRNRCAHL